MSEPGHVVDIALHHRFSGGFELDVRCKSEARSLALFGPSGSGKSTILSAIAGTFRPEAGRVVIDGRVLLDRSAHLDLPPRHRHVGLVLQDALLFPLLTVRENLLFGAPRAERRLDFDEVIALLEIQHLIDRMPRNLSGGERQRVALGRAVLSEPRLLLCDEPFSALDAARRDRLLPILTRIRDDLRIPLILVSHRVREVLAIADEVAMLEAGRIVQQGAPAALVDVLGGAEGDVPNFWIGTVEAEGEVRVGEHRLHLPVNPSHVGQRVRLVVDANHVALATRAPDRESPRVHMPGVVTGLVQDGGFVRVELDAGVGVRSMVTGEAMRELDLTIGATVWAVVKASAVEILAFSDQG